MTSGFTALTVFIRFPRTGKVKSRLARTVGPEKAAAFYRICAQQIIGELDRVPGKIARYISYSDSDDEDVMREWVGSGFRLIPQAEGDIGRRLEHSFRTLFGEGFGKVIIMASDTPDLSADIMLEAVNALDDSDIVIGPCKDGGYYLTGMKEQHGELFDGISWSTEKVLGQTLAIAGAKGLSVSLLAALRDIDTGDDLRDWVRESVDTKNPVFTYTMTELLI
jgi:rSAM/selenodomain-associated transferase 1